MQQESNIPHDLIDISQKYQIIKIRGTLKDTQQGDIDTEAEESESGAQN